MSTEIGRRDQDGRDSRAGQDEEKAGRWRMAMTRRTNPVTLMIVLWVTLHPVCKREVRENIRRAVGDDVPGMGALKRSYHIMVMYWFH